MSNQSAPFAGWAVIELFGHRVLAGYVTEATIAGAGMLRIDIASQEPVTQYYAPQALFSITPVTEEAAKTYAAQYMTRPAYLLSLPERRDEGETLHVFEALDDIPF